MNRKNLIIFLNSLAIALVINAQYLSYIFNLFLGISGGVVTFVYIFSALLVFLGALINGGKLNIQIKNYNLFLIIYVLIAFLLSFIFAPGKGVKDYVTDFIATGVITFFLIQNKYSNRYVLIINMMMGVFFCINPTRYINSSLLSISYDRASMFASYILVPIILSAIYHFMYFREKKYYLYILYLLDGFVLLRTITILGRGPILSLIVGVIIAFLFRSNNKWTNRPNKQKLRYIVLIVLGFILFVEGEELLLLTYNLFERMGIHVAALIKSVDLISSNQGELLNNRNIRWSWAIEMIAENPIFGNGIGSYYDRYQTWPHNFILQLFVELGILGALPILILFIRSILWMFFGNIDKEEAVMIGFLFSISIPRLMLSSYLWHHPEFWMFMFLCIVSIEKNRKINERNKNENRNINIS